jgi:Tripartite tricarboxylate transporter family receptor.
VIVESKPGANGNIATAYVSRAKPDGGTFLVGSSSPVVISSLAVQERALQPPD